MGATANKFNTCSRCGVLGLWGIGKYNNDQLINQFPGGLTEVSKWQQIRANVETLGVCACGGCGNSFSD